MQVQQQKKTKHIGRGQKYHREQESIKGKDFEGVQGTSFHLCTDGLMTRRIELKKPEEGKELWEKRSNVRDQKLRHPYILLVKTEVLNVNNSNEQEGYYQVTERYEKTYLTMEEKDKNINLLLRIAKGLAYLHSKNFVFDSSENLKRSIVLVGQKVKIDPFLMQATKQDAAEKSKQNDVKNLFELVPEHQGLDAPQRQLLYKLPMRTVAIFLNGLASQSENKLSSERLLSDPTKQLEAFEAFSEFINDVLKEMMNMVDAVRACHRNGFKSYLLGLLNILHLLNFEANVRLSITCKDAGSSSEVPNHIIFPNGQLLVFEDNKAIEERAIKFLKDLGDSMKRPAESRMQFAKALGTYSKEMNDLKSIFKGNELEDEMNKIVSGEFNIKQEGELMALLSRKLYEDEIYPNRIEEPGKDSKTDVDAYRLKYYSFIRLSKKMLTSQKRKEEYLENMRLINHRGEGNIQTEIEEKLLKYYGPEKIIE